MHATCFCTVPPPLPVSTMQAKTPSRQRARSDANRTPLTPSIVSGMNNVFVSSPTKGSSKTSTGSKYAAVTPADTTNPFITRPTSRPTSRAPSPVKRAVSGGFAVSDSLKRQASSGIIRKGGIESKLDVVSQDYVPPPTSQSKRSRSTPAAVSFHFAATLSQG